MATEDRRAPFWRRNIDRLANVAIALKIGNPCQVTKLRPVFRLASGEHACRTYYLFLVQQSRKRFEAGLSLSQVDVVVWQRKSEFYARAFNAISECHEGDWAVRKSAGECLDHLCRELQELSPGWNRVSVYACRRRRMPDPDLLLLEEASRCVLRQWYDGYAAYVLSRYYVCDYRDRRFILTRESAARISDIAGFWNGYYFREGFGEEVQAPGRGERTSRNDEELVRDFITVEKSADSTVVKVCVISWPDVSRPRATWDVARILSPVAAPEEVREAVSQLLDDRAYFTRCRICGKRKPLGWMQSMYEKVCQDCATNHFGVIY